VYGRYGRIDPVPREFEIAEILDALADALAQACGDADGRLDSLRLTAYAKAIRVLERYGRVVIETQIGRRVIARFIDRI